MDERLRQIERDAASGCPDAASRLVLGRLRSGALGGKRASANRARAAALAGSRAAQEALAAASMRPFVLQLPPAAPRLRVPLVTSAAGVETARSQGWRLAWTHQGVVIVPVGHRHDEVAARYVARRAFRGSPLHAMALLAVREDCRERYDAYHGSLLLSDGPRSPAFVAWFVGDVDGVAADAALASALLGGPPL